MTETISLIPENTEPMRAMFRKLWCDPKNVAFRRAMRMPVQAENYRWVTKDGADPLPEILDPPMCSCGEHVAEDQYEGKCYTCWENEGLEDFEGPDA